LLWQFRHSTSVIFGKGVNLHLMFAPHGLPARIVSVPAGHSDIQPTILSVAADQSLELLVMGGYGHSRLQERILGGVTREMLRCMTVPTLMSH
jgi:nucleotide-binding universal stress UspA family protein